MIFSRTGKMSKLIDLIGQKYGHLLVLERAENVGSRVAWRCLCDCGKTIVAKANNLLYGRQTSCGCQKKENGLSHLHYMDGTCLEMLRSTKVNKNSRSGVTGVFYDPKSNKWRVEITLCGKRHYLGRFSSFNEAVKARKKAEAELHEQFLKAHL